MTEIYQAGSYIVESKSQKGTIELTVYLPPHSHLLEVTCDPSQLVPGNFGSTCPLGKNVGEHRMCTLTGNMVRCGRFGEKDNLRGQTTEEDGNLDWLYN